jgi:hypothetical protein
VSPSSRPPEAQAATEGWLAPEAKLPVTLMVGSVGVSAVGQSGSVAEGAGAVAEEAEVGAVAEEAEEGEAVAAEEVEEAEVVVAGAEAQPREQSPRSDRLRPRTATRQRARVRKPPRISRRSEAAEAAIHC